jgi:hypothetical protein
MRRYAFLEILVQENGERKVKAGGFRGSYTAEVGLDTHGLS